MRSEVVPRPASAGARAVCYLIDLAASLAAAGGALLAAEDWVVAAIVLVECGVLLSLVRATTGRTPGGWATGTVATGSGTGRAPGLRRQARRSAIVGALHLSVLGPLLTALTSRAGKDWVDAITGTEVLTLRTAPQAVTVVDAYGRPTTAAAVPWQGEEPAHDFAPVPAQPVAEPAPSVTVPPVPVAQAVPQPQPSEPSPPAGPTFVSPPGPAQPATQPAVPTWKPAAAPRGPMVLADTGARVPLRGVLLVGRSPRADEATGARTLALPDPTRSLSRTHLRLSVAPDGTVWVEDAFSANGTVVRQPDGTVAEVPRGGGIPVQLGSTILIGERTLTVEG